MVKGTAQTEGLEGSVTPHRLRANAATLLLDAGMPLKKVRKALSHECLATTQNYTETGLRERFDPLAPGIECSPRSFHPDWEPVDLS
ncbi:tyrosine-type recombinase/integrase [Deinococcus oregonensis]|uniref:Tyrosine-type recombinase/integrase n=1 Tax=Deinococcus oregonensis TaxID=1805970 RepID=A0ABV6ATM0_9DEIO